VGLFVDEVYLNRSGLGMSDLTDIERIEILHGPQGTLYGKNTNAGAIGIFTRGPNRKEFEGYIEATLGDYDLQKYIAAASGPITDKLAYRISGTIHERDGCFDNVGPGDDLNDADDWNLRGKLLYDPTNNLSILLTGSHVDRSTHCCAPDAVQSETVNEQLIAQGLAPDKNDPWNHEGAVNVDNEFNTEASAISAVVDYQLEWGGRSRPSVPITSNRALTICWRGPLGRHGRPLAASKCSMMAAPSRMTSPSGVTSVGIVGNLPRGRTSALKLAWPVDNSRKGMPCLIR
jgi:iron complex outermembrane receptor protein